MYINTGVEKMLQRAEKRTGNMFDDLSDVSRIRKDGTDAYQELLDVLTLTRARCTVPMTHIISR